MATMQHRAYEVVSGAIRLALLSEQGHADHVAANYNSSAFRGIVLAHAEVFPIVYNDKENRWERQN